MWKNRRMKRKTHRHNDISNAKWKQIQILKQNWIGVRNLWILSRRCNLQWMAIKMSEFIKIKKKWKEQIFEIPSTLSIIYQSKWILVFVVAVDDVWIASGFNSSFLSSYNTFLGEYKTVFGRNKRNSWFAFH